MDQSSTLQISTEANERSSGEGKPVEKKELRAKNKDCVELKPIGARELKFWFLESSGPT
jgi:hypothetical protein